MCLFSVLLLLANVQGTVAQESAAGINGIRMSSAGDKTRVWIELNEPVDYHIFQLNDPPRLVIDFKPLVWNVDRDGLVTKHGFVKAIRFGENSREKSRLVLDLTEVVKTVDNMFVAPFVGADHRLVIEMAVEEAILTSIEVPPNQSTDIDRTMTSTSDFHQYLALSNGDVLPVPSSRPPATSQRPQGIGKKYVVIIDPGHGGKDPGATGRGGLVEKKVTLSAAKKLAEALEKTGRFEAVLTRSRDKFISLRDRPKIGREADGDLFISLHADSAPNAKLSGASVYTLSENASDKESAALATRENEADAVAGVEITGYSDETRDILLDLAMRRTLNESSRFAEILVSELRKSWQVLPRKPHRFAGFAVLSSADMPSVLIEMGYLTNSKDLKMLNNASERQRFISAVVGSIHRYFDTLGEGI